MRPTVRALHCLSTTWFIYLLCCTLWALCCRRWECGTDSHYDWGNTSLPYLNYHGENLLEPVLPAFLDKYKPSVYYCSAMALLKYRLLRDAREVLAFDTFLLGKARCTVPVVFRMPA